ncbi:MAG: hypothetical protein R3F13_09580 [Prosthecobacter sp.]
MSTRITLAVLSLAGFMLTACETPAQRAEKSRLERVLVVKRPAMAEKIIEDVVGLPEEGEPSMWDIAQTFPAYDWSINVFHRDGLTQEEDDRFLLAGDPSQPAVEIRQVSAKPPLKVEMAIGPIHDGYGFRVPKLHYTFKRVDGGWKRVKWDVTYHGPTRPDGEESPPLSEEENREKIEAITGEPYVDDITLASAEGTSL